MGVPEQRERLRGLTNLTSLILGGTTITDAPHEFKTTTNKIRFDDTWQSPDRIVGVHA
jgi:hypothetical protein